jgi:hypothetical protein
VQMLPIVVGAWARKHDSCEDLGLR